jgi:hypothetical protein
VNFLLAPTAFDWLASSAGTINAALREFGVAITTFRQDWLRVSAAAGLRFTTERSYRSPSDSRPPRAIGDPRLVGENPLLEDSTKRIEAARAQWRQQIQVSHRAVSNRLWDGLIP